MWHPFTLHPRPVWHPENTNSEAIMTRLYKYLHSRGPVSLALLLKAAFGSE